MSRLVTASDVRPSMESFFLDRADLSWFTFLLTVFGLHYLARLYLRE